MAAMLPASVLAADPVAVDDTFTIPVNSGVTNWAVMDNDIGTDLDLHEELTTPAHGIAFVNGTHVHYTPDEDFHGTDTFDYTIEEGAVTDVGTVTVIVNTPPVAVDDPTALCESPGDPSDFGGGFPVPEDFRFAGPPADTFLLFGNCALLENDTDVDGDTLTYEILTQPTHGEAVKVDEEFFTYKADPNYGTLPGSLPGETWQLDTFTYRAFDGLSYSDPATMSFWVAAINDRADIHARVGDRGRRRGQRPLQRRVGRPTSAPGHSAESAQSGAVPARRAEPGEPGPARPVLGDAGHRRRREPDVHAESRCVRSRDGDLRRQG